MSGSWPLIELTRVGVAPSARAGRHLRERKKREPRYPPDSTRTRHQRSSRRHRRVDGRDRCAREAMRAPAFRDCASLSAKTPTDALLARSGGSPVCAPRVGFSDPLLLRLGSGQSYTIGSRFAIWRQNPKVIEAECPLCSRFADLRRSRSRPCNKKRAPRVVPATQPEHTKGPHLRAFSIAGAGFEPATFGL